MTADLRDDRQDRSEHERKPRCYVAGPIAGVPDFRERFAAAVPAVEALGYEAVNPPLPHLHRPRRRALPRVLDPRPGRTHRARRNPGRAAADRHPVARKP